MDALLHRFAFLTADFADGADEKNAAAFPMHPWLLTRGAIREGITNQGFEQKAGKFGEVNGFLIRVDSCPFVVEPGSEAWSRLGGLLRVAPSST
jgi:hypothetical protein